MAVEDRRSAQSCVRT